MRRKIEECNEKYDEESDDHNESQNIDDCDDLDSMHRQIESQQQKQMNNDNGNRSGSSGNSSSSSSNSNSSNSSNSSTTSNGSSSGSDPISTEEDETEDEFQNNANNDIDNNRDTNIGENTANNDSDGSGDESGNESSDNGFPEFVRKHFLSKEKEMKEFEFYSERPKPKNENDIIIEIRYVPHCFYLHESDIPEKATSTIYGITKKSKTLLTRESWIPQSKTQSTKVQANLSLDTDLAIFYQFRHTSFWRGGWYISWKRDLKAWWGLKNKVKKDWMKKHSKCRVPFDTTELEKYTSYANISAVHCYKQGSGDRQHSNSTYQFEPRKVIGVDIYFHDVETKRNLRLIRNLLNPKGPFNPPVSVFERHVHSIDYQKGVKQNLVAVSMMLYLSLRLFVAINVQTGKIDYRTGEISDVAWRSTPFMEDHLIHVWGLKNSSDEYVYM